jgi:hypothetical protein
MLPDATIYTNLKNPKLLVSRTMTSILNNLPGLREPAD